MSELEYNGFKITRDNFTMYRITKIGKGTLYKSLRGGFTDLNQAKKAIDREVDNAKTTTNKKS